MANPNIVNVTSIYGKTIGALLTTSSADILVNTAASGKILKINTILVSNIDGVNNTTIDLTFYDASATTTYYLTDLVTVPAGSTLKVITKDTSIYLEEGDKLAALASGLNDLHILISYEEIS